MFGSCKYTDDVNHRTVRLFMGETLAKVVVDSKRYFAGLVTVSVGPSFRSFRRQALSVVMNESHRKL